MLSLSILLCSCAGLPGGDQQRNTTDASRALGPAAEQFSIAGRLVIKQGQRRDHLRFTWEHTTRSDTLLLSSALGQGVARLTRDAEAQPRAQLELADGKRYVAADWSSLAQQIFGQPLPLDDLPRWFAGAHPSWTGEQGKWQIMVTEARQRDITAGRQHQLVPRVLQVSADDVVMNIVVESWDDDDD